MSKLAVLELKGNLNHQGFYVTLHISQGSIASGTTIDGYLPASTHLLENLTQWQQDYRNLSDSNRVLKPYKIKHEGTINPIETCTQSAQKLLQQFQSWLHSDSFRNVELHLRQELKPNDSIQLLIRTANSEVQALPWHLWDFIEQYPQAEIALSGVGSYPSSYNNNLANSNPNKVNILAVLGDSKNIDIESDRKTLNQLPEAKVEFLVEPTHQELNDILYEKSWDILFFAGHSQTEQEGKGILRLNSTTELTIDEIRYGVRRAIANGLQLAIFNSCDGLGLAHALTKLKLPQMIVMREAIPDPVAQQFLKYFLGAFSQGQSLHLAQREARERLQGMEKNYPCASWLPVIYKSSAAKSLNWFDLIKQENEATSKVQVIVEQRVAEPTQKSLIISIRVKLMTVLVCSVLVSTLVVGVRFLGGLKLLEFWAFDSLMQLRPTESQDDRMLLVTIDEDDIRDQNEEGYDLEGSFSNQALAKVWQKLEPYDPVVVGVDIFREFKPLFNAIELTQANNSSNSSKVETNLRLSANTIFICQVKVGEKLDTIPPPPDGELIELGFSNVVLDSDNRIRRHLIGMSPAGKCNTDKSFSYQVAGKYLEETSHFQAALNEGLLTINGVEFPKFNPHSGAYHSIDMGGYNTLLNYRATEEIAPKISLSELLKETDDQILANLISNRIILIGTIAGSYKDYDFTPYGEMAGVEIQAHMISQILSAVEDNRPLLRTLPQWGDVIWIYLWTLGTGGVMILLRTKSLIILVVITTSSCVSVLCFLALQFGWWLPLIPVVIGCTVMATLIPYSRTIEKQF